MKANASRPGRDQAKLPLVVSEALEEPRDFGFEGLALDRQLDRGG